MRPVCRQLCRGAPVLNDPRQDQALADFVQYFTQWWLRLDFIRMWNHHQNPGPRTTNHAEGWHNSLSTKLPHLHPDLGLFIFHAQRWHNADRIRIQNLKNQVPGFDPRPRRPRDIQNDLQILQAKQVFDTSIQALVAARQPIGHNRVLQYLDYVQHRLGNGNRN